MSNKDDLFEVIPLNERLPELEEEVNDWMQRIEIPKLNTVKYYHIQTPHFRDPIEKEIWELEQIRRCIEGHNGMSPKMYFYYHFCKIQNISKGIISPDYWACDQKWFSLVEECMKSKKYSIVCVKRRRVGASWKEAADALHDCLFNPHFYVGMNSKTEHDSKLLFQKVKFMYSNLPSFLRPATLGNTAMKYEFAYREKDEWGNWITRGTQSSITVKAPTVTAWEGSMLGKWICDEAGKIGDLEELYALTEPCLYEQTRRSGVALLFGTSGEVGKEGKALSQIFHNAEAYDMKPFFFAGYNGLAVDEFGNDRIEDCVRWNVYKREKNKRKSTKSYTDFIQQYPLNTAEAFMLSKGTGVGDIIKINTQLKNLHDNPPAKVQGKFVLDANENVQWVPDKTGDWTIYEQPDKHLDDAYLAGVDPVDHDDEVDSFGLDRSGMSCMIGKKASGLSRPHLVAEYYGRPRNKADGYEQIILGLMYYGEAKALIERNRYRMISFAEERGLKYLLARAPQGVMRLVGGKINTIGVTMTDAFKSYGLALIASDIEDNYDIVPSAEFLLECRLYGTKNTDRVIAYLLMLALMKEDKREVTDSKDKEIAIPTYGYQRVGGRIVLRQ